MIRALLAIALVATVAAPAAAQSVAAAPAPAPARSCLESIPDSALTRVPVFAALAMLAPSEHAVPEVAANMLQSVVDRVEMMLGAKPDSLPRGEPAIAWDSISRGLLVTWHRDGRIDWRLDENVDPVQPTGTRLARVFAAALDTARAAGDIFMPWPGDIPGDSAQLRVYFVRPVIDEMGKLRPIHSRVAVPMLTVAAPRETPLRLVGAPRKPHYPEDLQSLGIEGKVTLQFVVDTTGRADSLTIRDLWPRDEPRLSGENAVYYQELVTRAKRTVMSATFAPGQIGGCKVRQVVQQPFTWLMH